MSSITVKELINCLQEYPDDYEVIMNWKWKEYDQEGNIESKNSIAMINAISVNEDWKEVRLYN